MSKQKETEFDGSFYVCTLDLNGNLIFCDFENGDDTKDIRFAVEYPSEDWSAEEVLQSESVAIRNNENKGVYFLLPLTKEAIAKAIKQAKENGPKPDAKKLML